MDQIEVLTILASVFVGAGITFLLMKISSTKAAAEFELIKSELTNSLNLEKEKNLDLAESKAHSDERLLQAEARLVQAERDLSAKTVEYKSAISLGDDLRERLSNEEQKVLDAKKELDSLLREMTLLKAELSRVTTESEGSEEARKELDARYVELKASSQTTQDQNLALNKHVSELQERVKSQEESERHLKNQFDQQLKTFNAQLKVFTDETLEQKSKAFNQASKESIDTVLKPFRDQIEGFQKRVNEVHTETVKGNTALDAEIKKVLEVGLKMQDEASNLSTALRGDKKALGTWSEVQAEILLEMSGLHEGREFHREANYKTDEGKDQRPDFVVNLPNDKHLIVDSKMSLNAYVDATAAETEEERLMHMKAHVQAIRKHVKDLSEKNYPKLKGINTPEYVFMFIGNEPAYLAAFDHEPNLFQEAYRKGIAIVTPNTLLSSLRIVSHLWSIDKQNSNTKELAEQASKVYDKLRVFAVKMEKLGAQIGTVQKTYSDSWNTLKDGNGSLSKQVAKFVDMGVSVKEKLPSSMTENQDVDLLLTEPTEADSKVDG